MNARIAIAAALILGCLAVPSAWPAAAIEGKVLAVKADEVTIQLEDSALPSVGDIVRIYNKLPDLGLEGDVAVGTVTKVEKGQALAKVKLAAPDCVVLKDDLVQIVAKSALIPQPVLLYAHRGSGNSALYIYSPQGTELRKLSDNADKPVQDEFPAWSPDGKSVVFSSDRTGQHNLWRLDANGVKRLTDFKGTDTSPAFSPDGTKIVFCRYMSPHPRLCIMNADGSNVVVLSKDAKLSSLDPAWSPDGKQIAFASWKENSKGYRLALMNADGSNVQMLSTVDNPLGCVYPAWSPDGKKIAYTDFVNNAAEIFIYDLSTKHAQQWSNLGKINTTPAWSPDGTRIAYQHYDSQKNACGLILADADGSHSTTVVIDKRTSIGGRPAWRPWPAPTQKKALP
jgi:TolB protein